MSKSTVSWLNDNAAAVFKKLIKGLVKPGENKVLDKHNYLPDRNGGLMSVHINCIGKDQYSIAHYYEQNMDLMADPEMEFWVSAGGAVIPTSFTQHGFPQRCERSVFLDDNGNPNKANLRMQRSHTDFANFWMENIADQQEITI